MLAIFGESKSIKQNMHKEISIKRDQTLIKAWLAALTACWLTMYPAGRIYYLQYSVLADRLCILPLLITAVSGSGWPHLLIFV